jgi:hypothetical protein
MEKEVKIAIIGALALIGGAVFESGILNNSTFQVLVSA